MADAVNWTGKSGTSYSFEVYPVGTEFNPVSAVYMLARLVPYGIGQALEALYVGETQSLVDRLNTGHQNHDGFKRATKLGLTHIGVHRCEGTANRARIELDLRHALNPECNREPVNELVNLLLQTR